jgi:3D (Asp-Asp-Asp) domain-containing protein
MSGIMQVLEQRRLTILGIAFGFIALALLTRVSVIIQVDGQAVAVSHYFPQNVEDILDRNHISLGEHDMVNIDLEEHVKNNTEIVVQRAFLVFIAADGASYEIITAPVTIAEAIALAGVALGEKDIVQTQPVELVAPEQQIQVIRVTEDVIVEDRVLRYEVENTTDDTLEKGLSKTIRAGENGLAEDQVKIVYYDGQEYQRELIASEVKQHPQNKVVAMGTITAVSRGGIRLDFQRALDARATAYTYTGHRTATGRNPAVGLVAVDPSVIPLGTRLYIEGYGYAEAADTGGAIKGNRVDLFMETNQECIKWGNRAVKVYVLN